MSLRVPSSSFPWLKSHKERRVCGSVARRVCGPGEMMEYTTVQRWGCSKLRLFPAWVLPADTCHGSLHGAGSVAMLLSLWEILLCRIHPLQPSGDSGQVFLSRCHLGTLLSPITILGFCPEKGRSVMAGLGKAPGHCTGEQWGCQQQGQSWAPGQHVGAGSCWWDMC